MATTEQARATIWAAIKDRGPYKVARKAGVSASMLYQFAREGGPCLGKTTVMALRPHLTEVGQDLWLAAMGVEDTVQPQA